EDPHWHYLHVRKMLWTNDGWPLISPERYAGETEQSVVPEVLPGNWEVLFLLKANNQQLVSYPLRFLRDGVIDDGTGISRWRFTAKNNLILTFYDQKTKLSTIYESRILPSWDWENYRPTLVFTGIGPRGVAIWGKKAD
ncbi:MAG TPA: glycoside hydrolase family 43 C-terminal domain-containing protein, partial [Bacillota bacterium]|nr:glycoside hydrolase family 43 C-terminal domain-containing protein [Bacillota bacterium]